MRVILRDVAGKFSWDCSALFGADGGGECGDGHRVVDSLVLRETFLPRDGLAKMVAAAGHRTMSNTPSPTDTSPVGKGAASPASSGNKVVISLAGGHASIPTRQRSKVRQRKED